MDIYSIIQNPIFLRVISLYLPAMLAIGLLIWRKPMQRESTGVLLATLWAFPAILALHLAAQRLGWWHFEVEGSTFMGMPIDLLFGWVILWATAPSLLPRSWPITLIVSGLIGIDLCLMPLMAPLLQLGPQWVIGEIIGVVLVTIPSLLVARWTTTDSMLIGRVMIQMVTYSAICFWFLPTIGVVWDVVNWQNLWTLPAWQLSLLLQLLAIPGLIGLTAVQEFAVRGGGTPLPLDPPKRLITTGIYAYVANPMQISGAVMFLALGMILQSFWLIMGAVVATVFSMGVADWSEESDLNDRYEADWQRYRGHVRKWRFRWRPWLATEVGPDGKSEPPDVLYTAGDCVSCSQVRAWFEMRHPSRLTLALAEAHPSRDLTRITYESGDGKLIVTGVAAIARALEHIHLGWAMVGFALRIPVIAQFVQLLVDVSGGGPRLVPRDISYQ